MRKLDLTDQKFGNLIARRPVMVNQKRMWSCDCSCGGTVDVLAAQLTHGGKVMCAKCKEYVGVNLIGVRSGQLTVESRLQKVGGRWKWRCKCDCGNYVEVFTRNIAGGRSIDCGCGRAVSRSESRTTACGLPKNLRVWRKIVSSYQSNARHKSQTFCLTEEECIRLFQTDCHYCGAPPARNKVVKTLTRTSEVVYNGIDRKDNALGYLLSNVVPCCTRCNYMKKEIEYTEFLAHIERIAMYARPVE